MHYLTNLENTMKTNYKVGELVYDADIYDGLNTSLTDLEFYKNGCLVTKMQTYLSSAVEQAGSPSR